MKNRKIFKKKNNFFVTRFFVILISFIIIFYFYFLLNKNSNFFIINEYKDTYYIIPENIGGKEIPDIGINILENSFNSNKSDKQKFSINNIKYSLQLYSSKEINLTQDMKNTLSNNINLSIHEFIITEFTNSLGTHYLLLYGRYNDRDSAKKSCNYLESLSIYCIVVNVQNL